MSKSQSKKKKNNVQNFDLDQFNENVTIATATAMPVNNNTNRSSDYLDDVTAPVGTVIEKINTWPQGLRDQVIRTFKKPPNDVRGKLFLNNYQWPSGLQDTIFKSCKKIPMRFFIVDDSGLLIIFLYYIQ